MSHAKLTVMEMHRSLAKQDLILNNFLVTEYVSQDLLRALDPLKTEFVLNNIYEFSSYLTGNKLCLYYKGQPFTAEPAISPRYACTWRYIPYDRSLHKYLLDFSKILKIFELVLKNFCLVASARRISFWVVNSWLI
jgi:hypothetical protein